MERTQPTGLAPPLHGAPQAGRSLVIVSNRLPFTLVHGPDGTRFERSPGGLVAALDPALSARGGVWIGWPGGATDQREEEAPFPTGPPHVHYRGVPLSAREVALYYGAFANRAL